MNTFNENRENTFKAVITVIIKPDISQLEAERRIKELNYPEGITIETSFHGDYSIIVQISNGSSQRIAKIFEDIRMLRMFVHLSLTMNAY